MTLERKSQSNVNGVLIWAGYGEFGQYLVRNDIWNPKKITYYGLLRREACG